MCVRSFHSFIRRYLLVSSLHRSLRYVTLRYVTFRFASFRSGRASQLVGSLSLSLALYSFARGNWPERVVCRQNYKEITKTRQDETRRDDHHQRSSLASRLADEPRTAEGEIRSGRRLASVPISTHRIASHRIPSHGITCDRAATGLIWCSHLAAPISSSCSSGVSLSSQRLPD